MLEHSLSLTEVDRGSIQDEEINHEPAIVVILDNGPEVVQ